MKKLFAIKFLLLLLFLITACDTEYKTNFDPPPQNASLDDVFPAEINGMKSNIKRLSVNHPLEGFTAVYGEGKINIDAILATDKQSADDFFKDDVVPRFDKMKNHFRGNINGNWRANGTDENGREWFAWVNEGWIFIISGSDEKNLSSAIKEFKYISE